MKKRNDEEISFLGKVILFVRTVFEKIRDMRLPERVVSHEKRLAGFEGKESPKEAKISFIFGMGRLFSISALCILLVAVLIFGGSIISYDNVYYMFKDIGYISSFTESRPSVLNYSRPFSNQDFAVFKNGLAVAGDSEIKMFTSTGRATLSLGSEFTNPKICASDATTLIYDQGRHTFKVYNSFISIYSETLDYPISSAHMASDGSFCIVTKSESYGSVVRVYDSKCRLESEYSRNDYIISVNMSPSGKAFAVLSLDASGGQSNATLTVVERGRSKPRASTVLNDVLPYTATFVSNDRIALISAESSHVFDLNCKEQNRNEYNKRIADVSFTDGGFAILFRENNIDSSFTLSVFGENGNAVSSHKIDGHVSDTVIYGNFAYLLMDGEVRRIDTLFGTVSKAQFGEENARLMVFPGGDVMACTDTAAYYISFN